MYWKSVYYNNYYTHVDTVVVAEMHGGTIKGGISSSPVKKNQESLIKSFFILIREYFIFEIVLPFLGLSSVQCWYFFSL